MGWVLFELVVGVVAKLLMRERDPDLGEACRVEGRSRSVFGA